MTTVITLYRWQSLGDAVDDIRRHAERLRAGGWEMADKVASAVEQFGASAAYDALVEHTGLQRHTLQNMASAARRFPPGQRNDSLSIAHHVAVLGLDEGRADYLLSEAEAHNLPVRTLRGLAHGTNGRQLPVDGNSVAHAYAPVLQFATAQGMTPADVLEAVQAHASYQATYGQVDDEPPYCNDIMYAEAEGRRYQSVRCPHCGKDVEL